MSAYTSADQNLTTDAKVEEQQNEEIETKLKGDAIGGTMYTQRFILKTLLKLKDLEWTEELEDDLCFLWDSTVEKEVCEFLMEIDFPSIACNIILEYNTFEYGRLTEIIIGIMANIIIAECEKKFDKEHINVILNLLLSTDSLVLIQIMRFLIAFAHNNINLELVTDGRQEDLLRQMKFILKSSTNFELITKTLEALSKMTKDSKTFLFFENEMLKISINSCIIAITEDEENEFELFSSEQRNTVKYLIEFVLNFSIHFSNNENLLEDIQFYSDAFLSFFTRLCIWYSNQENLLPITDELIFYFEASNYIFHSFNVGYNPDVFEQLFNILKILVDNDCEDINPMIEMFCYFIHRGNSDHIKLDFRNFQLDVEKVLSFIEKQDLTFSFDFDVNIIKDLFS